MSVLSGIGRSIARHWKENFLFAVVSLCVIFFLCIYLGNIQKNESQLGSLSDTLPVTGKVTSGNGGQALALEISLDRIAAIMDSHYTSDVVVTAQTPFIFGLKPPPNLQEVQAQTHGAVSANSLAAFPFLRPEEFSYLGGYDSTLLGGNKAVCLAKGNFMRENGLKLGDSMEVALLLQKYDEKGNLTTEYEYYASTTLRIAGMYDSKLPSRYELDRPDLIFPYTYINSLSSKKALSADSASFKVDTASLNTFKEEMTKAGFSSPDLRKPPASAGIALSINDEHYIKAATQLQRSLSMLLAFRPLVFSATVLMGFVVSYLLTRGRRREIAIMRTLGEGQRRIFLLFLLEAGVLALVGGLLGLFAAGTLGGAVYSPLLPVCFLLYWLGTAVALASLQRLSVMEILTKVD